MRPTVLFCDLDGTFVTHGFSVPPSHTETVRELKRRGWYVVAATGRHLRSVSSVIDDTVPFDEVIFSTGLGAVRWPSKELLFVLTLDDDLKQQALEEMLARTDSVMLHLPFPDNNRFLYQSGVTLHPDMIRRIALYGDSAVSCDKTALFESPASLLVSVVDACEEDDMRRLIAALPSAKIVRATSPLDRTSQWIEVYPAGAGKAAAAQKICDRLGIDIRSCVAVGNDFNDIELLQACGRGIMVSSFQALADYSDFETILPPEEEGFSALLSLLS